MHDTLKKNNRKNNKTHRLRKKNIQTIENERLIIKFTDNTNLIIQSWDYEAYQSGLCIKYNENKEDMI